MTTSYTRDRGYTRARRMGRDEEEGRQELRDLCDDPDCNFGDLLAAAIQAASPEQQQEVSSALREMGEDRRGSHSWARDRLERRRLGRDIRARRLGRDEPEPFPGRPRPGGSDPMIYGWEDEAADRRPRPAHDMAMDDRATRDFAHFAFPGAAKMGSE
jgi:hypothetical protein